MSDYYNEASYENAIMELFAGTLGYECTYGPDQTLNTTGILRFMIPFWKIRSAA